MSDPDSPFGEGQVPFEDPIEFPITDELDLHIFRPKEVKDVVPDYLEACREKGILTVRVIHGKGIGNLRRTVESILGKLDFVESHTPASAQMGGWGATMVRLMPLSGSSDNTA
ncbi:MAG: Smr/MutS family protein [Verrucomicrobia bacterium]|nr:Smr/MutS family protein [Verrucomicrobiota bacterium]